MNNVRLISKTVPDKTFLIDEGEASLKVTAEALLIYIARVSSSRENKFDEPHRLINYLIKNQHWSPFEHAMLTMEIITSRAIGRQILRHRSFTFQELSQRYAEAAEFVDVEMRLQAAKNRQSSHTEIGSVLGTGDYNIIRGMEEFNGIMSEMAGAIAFTRRLYLRALKMGIAKECARMILPGSTLTRMYMTGTLRSWIHFIQIRIDEHAQKEVRDIGIQCMNIFSEECPNISMALGWTQV